MNNSYGEAYKLFRRSGKEAGFYIAACLLSAGLYVLMCEMLGLEGAYTGMASFKASPAKSFIALIPEVIVTAWFAAGLTGRFTMDALTGAPEGMTLYAKGWFFRKLIADSVVAGAMWGPLLLLVIIPFASSVLALIWLLAAGWLSLRIALWLNISVAENRGLLEAMRCSFDVTAAQALRILFLVGGPLISAVFLSQLISKALPGQAVLVYYLKSLLNSSVQAFAMAVLAVIYFELNHKSAAADQKAAEESPA